MADRIIRVDPRRWRQRSRRDARVPQDPGPRPRVPRIPDFAQADSPWLTYRDMEFLRETTGRDPEEAFDPGRATEAVEALLVRDEVYRRVAGQTGDWVEISPQLYFHVVLRRFLPRPRDELQRRALRYVANLLSLFLRTDRVYRVQPGETERFEYLVDLLAEAAESDAERQFLVHAHLGNYALYQVGLNSGWIRHGFGHGRRLVDVGYYRDMGRDAYERAAGHRLARELSLAPVLSWLARRFDQYADALRRMQRLWLSRGAAAPQG